MSRYCVSGKLNTHLAADVRFPRNAWDDVDVRPLCSPTWRMVPFAEVKAVTADYKVTCPLCRSLDGAAAKSRSRRFGA